MLWGMESADLDDERAEELDTLQSIYPELVIDSATRFAAHVDLLVAPTIPLPATFEPEKTVSRLGYLPAIHVDILLPPEYPATAPPTIQISTEPPWLPSNTIRALIDKARSLWEEYGGGQVLFAYISYLQEAAEAAFELCEIVLPSSLQPPLEAYSKRMKRELFDKETFDCQVCLEPKKGSACYRMERCNHVFCIGCLQDYYNNCIQEGDVNNVKCLSTECGQIGGKKSKKNRLLSPKELLQIPIPLETVERYAKIKRKKKVEADPTMIYCPRPWCQGAMRTKKYPKITDVREMDASDSETDEPVKDQPEVGTKSSGPEKRPVGTRGMDRLAVCEDCTLAFCTVCLASWHGDFVNCQPRDKSQLTEDEQASLNFIVRNTTPCPTCAVPCQKSYGCNHMTCFQCKTHFCYLCSAWLNPDNPYEHFNNKKNKGCYQRLMDMAEGDMVDGNVQFWEQEAMRIQMNLNAENN